MPPDGPGAATDSLEAGMGRGSNGGRPVLDLFIEQWPMLIFVPAVVVVLVALVAVTAWWDRRDRSCLPEKESRRAGVVLAPSSNKVVVPSTRRSSGMSRSGWRWRTRCNCSWHTMAAEVGGSSVRPLVAADRHGGGS